MTMSRAMSVDSISNPFEDREQETESCYVANTTSDHYHFNSFSTDSLSSTRTLCINGKTSSEQSLLPVHPVNPATPSNTLSNIPVPLFLSSSSSSSSSPSFLSPRHATSRIGLRKMSLDPNLLRSHMHDISPPLHPILSPTHELDEEEEILRHYPHEYNENHDCSDGANRGDGVERKETTENYRLGDGNCHDQTDFVHQIFQDEIEEGKSSPSSDSSPSFTFTARVRNNNASSNKPRHMGNQKQFPGRSERQENLSTTSTDTSSHHLEFHPDHEFNIHSTPKGDSLRWNPRRKSSHESSNVNMGWRNLRSSSIPSANPDGPYHHMGEGRAVQGFMLFPSKLSSKSVHPILPPSHHHPFLVSSISNGNNKSAFSLVRNPMNRTTFNQQHRSTIDSTLNHRPQCPTPSFSSDGSTHHFVKGPDKGDKDRPYGCHPDPSSDKGSPDSTSLKTDILEPTVNKKEFTRDLLTSLGSIIYALLLVIISAFFYLLDLTKKTHDLHQMFNAGICGIGMVWLMFLHWDIQSFKRRVMNKVAMTPPFTTSHHRESYVEDDRISSTTEVIFNHVLEGGKTCSVDTSPSGSDKDPNPMGHNSYRFLKGRHSGSFYLKCGMAAFCFGHVIHEGLRCGHQIYYFATGDEPCQSVAQLILYTLRPIFSFYQLFMTFKYSNIVINRHKQVAHFGLMHLLGSSISFWFGTIIDDAVDFYINHHMAAQDGSSIGPLPPTSSSFSSHGDLIQAMNHSGDWMSPESMSQLGSTLSPLGSLVATAAAAVMGSEVGSALLSLPSPDNGSDERGAFPGNSRAAVDMECTQSISVSIQSSKIMPYMYPFSIEYNLCLAVIWFMVWIQIGKDSSDSDPHPFHHMVTQDGEGNEDIHFESNLVIRADCHAANKGLFAGLFVLLFSLVTMIMFFLSLGSDTVSFSLYVLYTQEFLLAFMMLGCSIGSYWYTCGFEVNPFTGTGHTMDTILLMAPLPMFFVNNILGLTAEIAHENWIRTGLLVLITIQVVFQTVFIIDALHRCSQSRVVRFTKPGRELITLSILLNLTSWIVYTFETKAAESFFSETQFYGETMWMIISHTTLPLMLFYRFHASVCLADIWKFAYEKAHTH